MHDRGGLVGTPRQRPRPGHTQLGDVVPVDLRERAEACRAVGPPPQQPIVCGGLLQHRLGDRSQAVEGIPPDRPQWQHRSWREHPSRGLPARRHRREQIGIGRQRRHARLHPVFLQHERHELRVRLDVERARSVLGHRRAREGEERLQRSGAPRLAERAASERRRERAVIQVLAMTRGAMLRVRVEPRISLLGGVGGGLPRRLRLGRTGERGVPQQRE